MGDLLSMDKTKMVYFEKEDILHLAITQNEETNSIKITPNITVELDEKGELIGIEILEASTFIRDSILESVQAKLFNLKESKT